MAETLSGVPMAAAVAGPPSPVAPAPPLPASVVTAPSPPQPGVCTRSTRRPARSATRTLPSDSASTSAGAVPMKVAFTNPVIWPVAPLKYTSREPPVLATTTSPDGSTVTPSGAVSVERGARHARRRASTWLRRPRTW